MNNRDTIEQRTREAAHLQLIAGNPLDADDIAMFEMFDREGFSIDQQRAYILEESKKRTAAKTCEASGTRQND
jgi:hypothetical protein